MKILKHIFKSFKINYWLLSVAAMVLIAGCVLTADYNTSYSNTDLSTQNYDSYAILPSGDGPGNSNNVDKIKEELGGAMVQEMRQRGYSMVNDEPDLLVHAHILFDKEDTGPIYSTYTYYYPTFNEGPWQIYYYQGYKEVQELVGVGIETVAYAEGTIVIDVIDAESHKIVWRGWVDDEANIDEMLTKADDYVNAIFDQYPVEQIYSIR